MSDTALTIRPLEPGDQADWRRLWMAYLRFYESTVDEAVYAETWSRLLLSGQSRMGGLIALQGGAARGLTHFLFHPHCWRVEDVCYLQDLYVAPEARGGGVGRALIEAVYTEAEQVGAGDVYWMTQDFNHTARKLYDAVGRVTPFIKYVKA